MVVSEKINKQHQISENEIVLHILKELNQTERNILGLYFYEKLSINSIAILLNLSALDVEEHLELVIAAIKNKFKEEVSLYEQTQTKTEIQGTCESQKFNFSFNDSKE